MSHLLESIVVGWWHYFIGKLFPNVCLRHMSSLTQDGIGFGTCVFKDNSTKVFWFDRAFQLSTSM